MSKMKILFLCTHNSARSQMAEGIMRALYGEHYEVFSAGTEATLVNPFAVKALAEIGIDISGHRSKKLDEFKDCKFDYVVTVCDHAKETCPIFPGAAKYIHKSFKDPSAMVGNDEEKLDAFRKSREEIKRWLMDEFSCKN